MLLIYFTLLLSFTLFNVVSKVYFYLYAEQAFSTVAAGGLVEALLFGLRFDFAIAALLSLGLVFVIGVIRGLLLSKLIGVILTLLFLALAALNASDIAYFLQSSRHLGYEIGNLVTDFWALIYTVLLNYKLVFISLMITAIFFSAITYWLVRNIKISFFWGYKKLLWFASKVLIILAVSAFAIRGGVVNYPLEPQHVYQIGDSKLALIATSPSYNFVHSQLVRFDGEQVRQIKIKTDLNVSQYLQQLFPAQEQNKTADFKSANIVLIMLESWANVDVKIAAPFFNQLKQQGMSSQVMIAGGARTSEGLFALLCSFPNPLGYSIARNQLQNYRYRCLPDLLAEQGYRSVMIQGTNKETAGVGSLAQKLGVQKSFGKLDITQKLPSNLWGAHDEDIYGLALNQLQQIKEPFFMVINTNSTHDNTLPAGEEFVFGNANEQEKKLSVLNFADKALKNFWQQLNSTQRKLPTIVVLIADHTHGIYDDGLQQFNVPFVLLAPQIKTAQTLDIAHQNDIAPTLLDLIGLPAPHWFTGKSLLQEAAPRFSYFYHAGLLYWLEKDKIVAFNLQNDNPVKNLAQLNCYSLQSRSYLTEQPCEKSHHLMAKRALSFSFQTQKLLFEGKSLQFNAPRPKKN